MREGVEIDVRGLWTEMQARPPKQSGGAPRIFSNEEQWLLWLQKKRIPQKDMCRALRSSTDRINLEYKRMEEAGGPKGKRPEWMV